AKNPSAWFRTIDKIYPSIASEPKLLIPDIKGEAQIVYDKGQYYPHHNLYFITANGWDLRALQTVLLSGIAHLFVSTYSTQMRGGYLRFQAQYLRRIRLPIWTSIPEKLKERLIILSSHHVSEEARELAYELYGLTPSERRIMNRLELCL